MVDIKHLTSLEDFYPSIRACALAARICYSDGNLSELLKDDRVNGDRIKQYLASLVKLEHHSIFSHAIVYKQTPDAQAYSSQHFKSHFYEPNVIGLSLRHYLESMSIEERQALMESLDVDKCDRVEMINLDSSSRLQIAALKNTRVNEPGGWLSIFVDGLSRAGSHQLVRHSSLNFNMRSQRYSNYASTKFYMPALKYPMKEGVTAVAMQSKIEMAYKTALDTYKELIRLGVKKEDARFVLPEASTTTLLISGTIDNWRLYIKARDSEHAQDENRILARAVKAYI